MAYLVPPNKFRSYEKDIIFNKEGFNTFCQTSFITTFIEESLAYIDIQNFIEAGLRIIRFRMTIFEKEERLKILGMLRDALDACCKKYGLSSWPIAVSIDVPNACIRTGLLDYNIQASEALMKHRSIVELTSDKKYWNLCNSHRVFMDDCYTFKSIKVGTEMAIRFGEIIMVCTEVVSNTTVKCQILREGMLRNADFLSLRGLKHLRPPMGKNDMEVLKFALENKFDVVIINCVRYGKSLKMAREYFEKANCRPPLIVATIYEQEGLDNFDEIVQEADAIILAREFLAYGIADKNRMLPIQMKICAKCRSMGVPIYISGDVLENTLLQGKPTASEISDVANIVLQGGGLFFRNYSDANYLLKAVKLLNSICKTIETVADSDFWDLVMAVKPPLNAADACSLGCAIEARQTLSKVIVVLTVTGKSAILLSRWCPECLIIAVSTEAAITRRLLFYRGLMPLIYDEKPRNSWHDEMSARIDYAIDYAVKHDILKYGENYIVLRKGSSTSSYADCVSFCKVTTGENFRLTVVCDDPTQDKSDKRESMAAKRMSKMRY